MKNVHLCNNSSIYKTTVDEAQKPTFSPPGYATSRLRPENQLHFLQHTNAIYRMSPELNSVDKANKKWLPRQRSLRDPKKLISHGSSTAVFIQR